MSQKSFIDNFAEGYIEFQRSLSRKQTYIIIGVFPSLLKIAVGTVALLCSTPIIVVTGITHLLCNWHTSYEKSKFGIINQNWFICNFGIFLMSGASIGYGIGNVLSLGFLSIIVELAMGFYEMFGAIVGLCSKKD